MVAILLLAQQYRSSRIRLDILNRASLIQPRESALSFLLQSEVDTSYIRCFGFDVRSFNAILAPFAADYTSYTLHQDTNRLKRLSFPLRSNRKVSASLCLGLVLSFYRSQAEQHVLCLVSGIVPTCCSWYLTLGHLILNVSANVLHGTWLTCT